MGRIGQGIARRGAHGFGMKVLYHNRSRLPADTEASLRATYVDLDTLLAQSDHLVTVLPYTPASHHIIDAAALAKMKPTATLVNIARGGIVDELALADALANGHPAAAGLDVYEGEPKVRPELLALRNVVLTPHIGSASLATRTAMVQLAVDNLAAGLGLDGGPSRMPSAINADAAMAARVMLGKNRETIGNLRAPRLRRFPEPTVVRVFPIPVFVRVPHEQCTAQFPRRRRRCHRRRWRDHVVDPGRA